MRFLIGFVAAAALAVAAGRAPAQDADDGVRHEGIIGPIGGRAHVHDGAAGRDCCGRSAQVLAARFAAALRARPGKVHEVETVRFRGGAPHPAVAGEVLVRLRGGADVDALAGRHGLEVRRRVASLGVFSLGRAGADATALAAALAAEPAVASAAPNWIARCSLTPNDDLFPLQKGGRSLDLERAWDLSRGAGVTVAVLDTGIDAGHPDLQGALPAGGWVDVVNASATPFDDNGHGTAISGIIAARFQNALGIAGVAPEASILAIKVADRAGMASFADVIAGLDEAVRRGAPIVNLSLGAYVDDGALRFAVDRAVAAGTLVLAAAGNENLSAATFPAAYPGVLAVGGSGVNAEIAFSTAIAPSLAFLAPAEHVVAPLPGGVFGFVGGTSASTAHAAGIAALVRAHAPGIDRARLEQVLRHATDAVPALAAAGDGFAFGRIGARRALDRDAPSYVDVGVVGWAALPLEPQVGQPPLLRVRVRNEGGAAIPQAILKAQYYPTGSIVPIEIAVAALAGLSMGEMRTVDLPWPGTRLPAAGTYDVEVLVNALAGETETSDNALRRPVRVLAQGAGATADVQLLRLEARADLALPPAGIEVDAVVRNLGHRDETNVDVTFLANGAAFRTERIPFLAIGAEQTVKARWPLPAAPPDRAAMAVEVAARAGETSVADNAGEAAVRIGVSAARPVDVLYQQGNFVDLISDAPFRVAGNRPYVPVLLFAAAKGDPDPDTYLTLRDVEVHAKAQPHPGAAGTLVYKDATSGGPSTVFAGLEATDELGAVQPTADIFQDQELRLNGRHMILRVPRAAWSLPALPAEGYLDVRMDWRYHRRILWVFDVTRSGSNRKVLKVTFADGALPSLPGDNHYYDVHNHTIAEWYFASFINIFAPRKAYGGPITMIGESAYSIGMIDAPTDLRDLVVATDHNCFFNTTVGDPDHPDRRPPFGPTSPGASLGSGGAVTPEHERYRELFGLTAGEEIAVHALQGFTYAGMTIGAPMGAHMIGFRAEHVEGPWHGGGWIPDPSSPNIEVRLEDTLKKLATANPALNAESFVYAAHPFSDGLGWSDANRRLALGLDPAHRTADYVHASPPGFVFKGFQLFNGRSARGLPYSVIDFDDLNPWIDATWQAGDPRWDGKLTEGLVAWHEHVSDTLSWAFTQEPDAVFVRKVFIAGGSDAHGDFNYSVSRLATPVLFSFTFTVSGDPYAAVRTYVFGDGMSGQTRGERLVNAFSAGRSVATDGPVVSFTMDAEGRFDGQRLRWHDGQDAAEDDDGRIGGGGAFDGLGTMLVVRGASSVWFRHASANATDFGGGPIAAIKIYKDTPGAPNPSRHRAGFDEPVGVGALAVAATAERLDPGEEGAIMVASAFSLGAFTGGDPDVAPIGVEDRRCYTNPVWALPVAVTFTAAPASADTLAPGELAIALDFPVSMNPNAGGAELKALDRAGDSTDGATPGEPLQAAWSRASGMRDARLTLTNATAIPLTGDAYPGAGVKTFVVYFRGAPEDLHGNPLNRLAFTIAVAAPLATGGSASSPVTSGSVRSGAGGGGGGCSAGGMATTGEPLPQLIPYALLLIGLIGRARSKSGRSI